MPATKPDIVNIVDGMQLKKHQVVLQDQAKESHNASVVARQRKDLIFKDTSQAKSEAITKNPNKQLRMRQRIAVLIN